jgi:hypothetical protein
MHATLGKPAGSSKRDPLLVKLGKLVSQAGKHDVKAATAFQNSSRGVQLQHRRTGAVSILPRVGVRLLDVALQCRTDLEAAFQRVADDVLTRSQQLVQLVRIEHAPSKDRQAVRHQHPNRVEPRQMGTAQRADLALIHQSRPAGRADLVVADGGHNAHALTVQHVQTNRTAIVAVQTALQTVRTSRTSRTSTTCHTNALCSTI